ncbi:MAG: YdcF family protein [Rhodobacteraceae bacterium]|nr:YdcF family protein [Paracoccaceae bacterium]
MDGAFFIAGKLAGLALKAETWLALGLALTVIALWRGNLRSARRWGTGAFAFLLFLGAVPLGQVLLHPLETEYPIDPRPETVHGIVVLGGVEDRDATALWGEPQVNAAGERLTAAAMLARRYPQAQIVFTGGSGSLRDSLVGDGAPRPSVAIDMLTQLGVAGHRIAWESRSRNTAENARFSHAMIGPNPGQTWLLVTSASHMGRAMRSFERVGWPGLVAYPVDYRIGVRGLLPRWDLAGNLDAWNKAVKEHVGRIAYTVAGR